MNCKIAIEQLIKFLFTETTQDTPLAVDAEAHIATCPTCLRQLQKLTESVTEFPEPIRALLDQLNVATSELNNDLMATEELNFDELERLAAYTEGQVTGEEMDGRDPAIAQRLESDALLRAQRDRLVEMIEAEAAGLFGPPIIYPTRGQSLWQMINEQVNYLTSEIMIQVDKTDTAFANLSASLTSQLTLMPAGATRAGKPRHDDEQPLRELLELPHPEANLNIRVSMEPSVHEYGVLVIQVQTIEPIQPVEQANVMLFDEDQALLERIPSNADGLVTFHELELGKYTIQVDHASQQWRFSVTLQRAGTV